MPQGRITVLSLGRGAHAFRRLSDPRIVLVEAQDLGPDEAPDLIAFAGSRPDDLDKALQDPDVWSEPVRARSRIVFDLSGEGFAHRDEVSLRLHHALGRAGIDPGRAALVTQNRLYRQDYEAFCAGAGLTPMGVLNYDFWIRRFFSGHEGDGEAVFNKRRKRGPGRRAAHRSRRFVCLNLSPRPAKVLVLLHLLRHGLWDLGHVSFGGFAGGEAEAISRQLSSSPFAALFEDVRPAMPELEARGQVLFLSERLAAADPTIKMSLALDAGLPEYYDSWFSVVTESEMTDRPIRITEKPFSALVNFQPLVLFGNPGSLALVRELGFRTFAPVIDERYDEEPDPARRFRMAWGEVERLCRMDGAELARLEDALAETLTFNAHWGLTRLPAIYAAEDARFVDRLLAATGLGAAAAGA